MRLVFYDQRSHGRSDRSDPEHASIDQLGRDLGAVLDTLVPRGPDRAGRALDGRHGGAGAGRPAPGAVRAPRDAAAPRQRVVGVALLSTSAGRLGALTLGPAGGAGPVQRAARAARAAQRAQARRLIERGRALGSEVAWVFTRRLSFAGADVDPATVDYLTEMIAATRIEVVADFYPAIVGHDKLAALPVLGAGRRCWCCAAITTC